MFQFIRSLLGTESDAASGPSYQDRVREAAAELHQTVDNATPEERQAAADRYRERPYAVVLVKDGTGVEILRSALTLEEAQVAVEVARKERLSYYDNHLLIQLTTMPVIMPLIEALVLHEQIKPKPKAELPPPPTIEEQAAVMEKYNRTMLECIGDDAERRRVFLLARGINEELGDTIPWETSATLTADDKPDEHAA